MQTMRLETKDGVHVADLELPANGEPDAIAYGERIFVRRLMKVTQPPTKNSPEVYFEATTHHMDGPLPAIAAAPAFDKVTGPTTTTAKPALAPTK
jgi:hypothetical protein